MLFLSLFLSLSRGDHVGWLKQLAESGEISSEKETLEGIYGYFKGEFTLRSFHDFPSSFPCWFSALRENSTLSKIRSSYTGKWRIYRTWFFSTDLDLTRVTFTLTSKEKEKKKKENENFPRHRRRNTKRARTISVYIFLSQRRVICTQRPWKNITGNLSYFPLKFRFSPREMQAFLPPFHQCWHWSPRFLDKAKDNGPCRLTRRGRIEFFFCLIYPRSLI